MLVILHAIKSISKIEYRKYNHPIYWFSICYFTPLACLQFELKVVKRWIWAVLAPYPTLIFFFFLWESFGFVNEMVWYEWGLFPRRRSGYLQYFFLSYYSLKVVKHQIWTVLAHYPTAPMIICFYKNPAVLWVNWFGTSKGLLVAEDQDTCNISLWVITVWKSWNVKFELFWRSTLPPHNFFVFFNNLLVLWVNWFGTKKGYLHVEDQDSCNARLQSPYKL